MKKTVKILSIILIVCMLCTLFSGCNFVDELRENQAFYNKNAEIVLGEYTYRPLWFVNNEFTVDYDYSRDIYVTEEDVPVLLSSGMGDLFSISKDGIFMCDYFTEENVYCRSDKYESIAKRMDEEYNPTAYMYSYGEASLEDLFEYETKNYIFSAIEKEAVDKVLAEVAPYQDSTVSLYDASEYAVEIYSCTDDLLFRQSEFYLVYHLGGYYIVKFDEYYNELIYTIPNEYNSIFKETMKNHIEEMDEYMTDDYYY